MMIIRRQRRRDESGGGGESGLGCGSYCTLKDRESSMVGLINLTHAERGEGRGRERTIMRGAKEKRKTERRKEKVENVGLRYARRLLK